MTEPASFLLVRPADLVLVGIGWIGCAVEGNRLRAIDTTAAIIVTFPPQAMAETKVRRPIAQLQRVRLAGVSRVRFLAVGATMPLTVEGILAALGAAPVVGGEIEIPFGLVMAPGATAGGDVRAGHFAAAVTSEAGVQSLWRMPFRAAGGLRYVPVGLGAGDSDLDTAPLSAGQRGQIRLGGVAQAGRLELTALGGSLLAHQVSESFEWEHDTVLGRDQRVRVQRRCVLWPFGHRATFVEIAERQISAVAGGAVAGLQRTRVLSVTEPVRVMPDDGTRQARAFPFSEVEVLTTTVTDLDPQWNQFVRPLDATQPMLDELEAVRQLLAGAEAALAALGCPTDAPGLANSTWPGAWAAFRMLEQQAIIDEFAGILADPDPSIPADQLAAWQLEVDNATFQISLVKPVVAAALARLAPLCGNFDAMLAAGIAEAISVRDLRADVAAREQVIAALSVPVDRLFLPRRPDGTPVQFEIRCAGALGDVHFSMPLVVVNDFTIEPDELFVGYHSLTDPELETLVAEQLGQPHTDIKLPGVAIDVVRSQQPRTTDVQEVHALRLTGVKMGGTFRPILHQFDVELPELRTLLPGLRKRVPVSLTDAFANGHPTDTALQLLSPLAVSFADQADRGGGMITPTFTADVISRTFGPVDRRSLPGASDVLSAFQDMTLLGVPLSSVLQPGAKPPEIIQLLVAGKPPGVQMQWHDLALKSNGPFLARPPAGTTDTTTLQLDVEQSADVTKTRCELTAFTLSLPVREPKLLLLSFGSLVFSQDRGAAPTLEVTDPNIEFAGDLNLLKRLQEEVDLGDLAPAIDVRPSGITATYGLQIPAVPCSVFELRNVVVHVSVDIPFRGGSTTVSVGFASRDNPFHLKVLTFGGGGYLLMRMDGGGLQQLEASLDFGASVSVDFGVVTAEVHALGGVRYVMRGEAVSLSGFIRIGGSIDILGLVSVSIQLVVELTYDSAGNRLIGRATLVIEIDLTLYSDSVELDSGEWVLVGGGSTQPVALIGAADTTEVAAARSEWVRYQRAFAS